VAFLRKTGSFTPISPKKKGRKRKHSLENFKKETSREKGNLIIKKKKKEDGAETGTILTRQF